MDQLVPRPIDDGVSVGLKLPDEIVEQILSFARSHTCFSGDRPAVGFLPQDVAEVDRVRQRDVVAEHYFEMIEQCEAISHLSEDPALLSIASVYLGCASALIRGTREVPF